MVDPVGHGVLAQRGDEPAGAHPLELHAQDVDDVGVGHVAHVRGGLHPERRAGVAGQQGGRRDQRDARPHHLEAADARASDPGVGDVADEGDVEPVERPDLALDRVEVEQGLGGVLVLAVAGVDDRGVGVAGGHLARPDGGVADDEDVRRVGVEGDDGVLERLPLLHARAGALDVDDVGGEALARQLERRRGARRCLEEHVDDGPAAEGRHLLDVAGHDLGEAVADAQDARDLRPVEVADGQQRASCHALPPPSESSTTSSRPSISARCTLIRSVRAVGRFLPT